jgi:signal transduction histidine kinase
MKLRTRIFALSTAVALVAIGGISVASLASGRKSIIDAELASLERECGRSAAALDGSWRAMSDLREAFPEDALADSDTASSLGSFLRYMSERLFRAGAELELRDPQGKVLFASGELIKAGSGGPRPEAEAAARSGPTYLLRRIGDRLVLFYSAPIAIGGTDAIATLASGMEALALFEKGQLALLGLVCALASILLLGASYVSSRAIAGRLEELAHRASSLADGDYGARAPSGGDEEAASLARSFNSMADAIREKVARLEAEKADRQAFIDDLTHELRTPVTSIVGFAQLLGARSWDEGLFADGLGRIEAEGKRILALTESLKRLLVSKTASRDFESVEAAAFLESLAAEARPGAEAAGIELSVAADEGGALCDPELVSIALRNFIDNSTRASSVGAKIILGFDSMPAGKRFYVRDFGRGMSDEELAHAGEPFYRSGRKDGGFGLGLAICKEIAESQGAVLGFERPKEGGLLAFIAFSNLQPVYPADAGA